MTLTPSIQARGVEGTRPERNHLCAAPGCVSLSQHGHHIWPRGYLRSQPQEWVELADGRVFCNVIGLCIRHHDQVTGGPGGHKARIEYGEGTFYWMDLKDAGNDGLLFPPPHEGEPSSPRIHQKDHERHLHLAEGETCDRCGYTKPTRRAGPKRKVKTWTVNVPADAEIGGDVLDGWVEEFAAVLGLDPASPRLLRYHVLALVLAWASQNEPQLISDIRESSGRAA